MESLESFHPKQVVTCVREDRCGVLEEGTEYKVVAVVESGRTIRCGEEKSAKGLIVRLNEKGSSPFSAIWDYTRFEPVTA